MNTILVGLSLAAAIFAVWGGVTADARLVGVAAFLVAAALLLPHMT